MKKSTSTGSFGFTNNYTKYGLKPSKYRKRTFTDLNDNYAHLCSIKKTIVSCLQSFANVGIEMYIKIWSTEETLLTFYLM